MDTNKLNQFINDINNLVEAERLLENLLTEIRGKQLKYGNAMDQLSNWSAGEGAKQANLQGESLYVDISRNIVRLQDCQLELRETRKRLDSLMKAEIQSGPKW